MSVVVAGRFTTEQQEALRLAVARAGSSARFCPHAIGARWVLGDETPPSLILLDAAMADLEPLMTWIRSHARLMGTMIVAIVPSPNEDAFIEAHQLGADDVVVAGDTGAITRRVAALTDYDPTRRPPATMGRAVLAHAIEDRRRLIGRVLRLAGFDVDFAVDALELERVGREQPPPKMLVASERLPNGSAHSVVAQLRAATTEELPCVWLAARDGQASDGRPMVVAEHAPPDNLLFAVNELLRPRGAELRASARLLHAGLCAFRSAGSLSASLALTYNISREGIYVRTLAALERDTDVWLELRPPSSDRVVHLRGRVAWARKPGLGPGGAVPPGFGIRICEAECPPGDLAEYQSAYARLRDTLRLAA